MVKQTKNKKGQGEIFNGINLIIFLIVLIFIFIMTVLVVGLVGLYQERKLCEKSLGEYSSKGCLIDGKLYQIVNVNTYGLLPKFKIVPFASKIVE